jgi:seryl-tRNA(Sec) selenium transferase
LRKLSSAKERVIVRRSRIAELYCKGLNEIQIGRQLDIPRSTVGLDIRTMRRQSITNLTTFVEERLPHEADMLLENTNTLLRIAWTRLEKDIESGKLPYQGIESILHILEKKDGFLENKLHLSEFAKDTQQITDRDIQERVMREAYEAERHRS